MTLDELLVIAVDLTTTAFEGAGFSIHATTPDATGLPAVWVELASGTTNKNNGGAMHTATLRTIAAIDNVENGPTNKALVDAADRLIAVWRRPARLTASWRWAIGVVDVGGVEHTGLLFDTTIDYPAPC